MNLKKTGRKPRGGKVAFKRRTCRGSKVKVEVSGKFSIHQVSELTAQKLQEKRYLGKLSRLHRWAPRRSVCTAERKQTPLSLFMLLHNAARRHSNREAIASHALFPTVFFLLFSTLPCFTGGRALGEELWSLGTSFRAPQKPGGGYSDAVERHTHSLSWAYRSRGALIIFTRGGGFFRWLEGFWAPKRIKETWTHEADAFTCRWLLFVKLVVWRLTSVPLSNTVTFVSKKIICVCVCVIDRY